MVEISQNILELKNIYASYSRSFKKMEYVLHDLSLAIKPGECLGLVGESGSGKTTLANLITGFVKPVSGEIIFQGRPIHELSLKQRAKQFNCGVQMVFQDPYNSFNPIMKIGQQLMEPLEIQMKIQEKSGHGASKLNQAESEQSDNESGRAKSVLTKSDIESRVRFMLEQVGLSADYFDRYPHQLSGGQLQRVALGCALVVQPSLLIADEPVSSLDVSVQAQVLDLIADLRQEFEFSCLFISHDLAVIYHLCDTVAVLNKGIIVEHGNVEDVFKNPQDDYTKKLILDAGY